MQRYGLSTYHAFKRTRALRWTKEDRPANPVDAWRTRHRRYAASLQANPFIASLPYLALESPAGQTAVGGLEERWLGLWPAAALSFNSAAFACPSTAITGRLLRWWRSFESGLGSWRVAKLRYKGKSFRWHRRRGSVLLRFGHSHLVTMRPKPNVRWRKHGRTKMLFFGTNAWYLRHFLQKVIWWRPMNIYHGRGLRLVGQTVWRKAGKVSAYR